MKHNNQEKYKIQKIKRICNNEYEYFFNKENVVGVGLGYKIKQGFITHNECIKVFVSKKLTCDELKKQHEIPKNYKEVETDVVESGAFKSRGLTAKIRPVIGGYSIGPSVRDIAGTLGCLVTDGRDRYILSNNHVLCRLNELPLNTKIIQPSIKDGGVTSSDVIAILSKYIPIKFIKTFSRPINYVDCAIAKVINKSLVSSKIAFIGNIESTIVPVLGTYVLKVGRTTDMTFGSITGINCTIKVEYSNNKSAIFKNQISTSVIVDDGDSGSMLLDHKKNLIGMLVSSAQTISMYNPINLILDSLKVRIVNN